jgi:hypothetical protein
MNVNVAEFTVIIINLPLVKIFMKLYESPCIYTYKKMASNERRIQQLTSETTFSHQDDERVMH